MVSDLLVTEITYARIGPAVSRRNMLRKVKVESNLELDNSACDRHKTEGQEGGDKQHIALRDPQISPMQQDRRLALDIQKGAGRDHSSQLACDIRDMIVLAPRPVLIDFR